MATALDIITGALTELGTLASGETPTAAEAADALAALNRLIDQWAAEKLLIYAEARTETAIVASQASYTVGSGGDINIARPQFLEDVRYQDTSTTPDGEFPLVKLTDGDWQALAVKDQTSEVPSSWYYNPTYPTGTLYLWPVPTGTTLQVVTYTKTAVSELAATSTTVSLPPGYRRMLVKSLALELAPSYEKQPNPLLQQQATEAKAVVMRANTRLVKLSFPPDSLIGSAGGGYSIYRE